MNFQNVVTRGTDTPIVIKFFFRGEFASLGLNNFTQIDVSVGGENYSTTGAEVWIEANDELRINLGQTALDAGEYNLTIKGISPTYNDGYVLASPETFTLAPITIV